MHYREIDGIPVFGREPDMQAVEQMQNVIRHGDVAGAALMADAHLGYSMPIGGVTAYRNTISPSGVGYDIGCGVMAVETDVKHGDIRESVGYLLDTINRRVAFGVGRKNPTPIDHELFDHPAWVDVPELAPLKQKAAAQLGTVGSGNHYVDLLVEVERDGVVMSQAKVWIATHFGSRGLGHSIASGFLNLAKNQPWGEPARGEEMMAAPTLIPTTTDLGTAYIEAMHLAGQYAYAGRQYVIEQVADILGAEIMDVVHNHHNYAFYEEHNNEKLWVVRKGATPAMPGERGFVGGSMGDIAAIVEGVASATSDAGYQSTVHGAGRIHSRSWAKGSRGKKDWQRDEAGNVLRNDLGQTIPMRDAEGRIVMRQARKGMVTRQMMSEATQNFGVVVRGGDVDESPHVYRKLDEVLDAHEGTIKVVQRLRPIGVVMAGADVVDPFKD